MKKKGRHKRAERSRHHEELVQCRICGRQFKAVGWAHLQTHGLTSAEYRKRFGVDYLFSDQYRKETSDRRRRGGRRDRYVPRDRAGILRVVRRHAGQRSPLTCAWLQKRAPSLLRQATYVFGSWGAVREAAQLGPPRYQRWSDARIIAEIRRRASAELGIYTRAVQKEAPLLYKAALGHFGSWKKAVEASGFDYSRVRRLRVRTRETVARDLRVWVDEHGSLSPRALEESNGALYKAAQAKYGSLEKAARWLRLPFHRKKQRWSRDRIKGRIRRRAAGGRSLRGADVGREDMPLLRAACLHFGSWGDAVKASGFDYSKVRWTKFRTREAVARDLRRWVREHGPLNATALETTDGPLYQATRKAFGTPGDAARELGLPYRRRIQSWSRERVVEEVRRRAAAGLPLNVTSVRDEDGPLYSAACTHWGSWAKAAEASGLDYSRIRRRKVASGKT